jgi:hypothetical protein
MDPSMSGTSPLPPPREPCADTIIRVVRDFYRERVEDEPLDEGLSTELRIHHHVNHHSIRHRTLRFFF